MDTARALFIDRIARRINSIQRTHPVRVAIDGVDAAGKTTFANEMVQPLEKLRRPVIKASIDGFHHPREIRYRRGRLSPEGYFHDSFNYKALKDLLLAPLGTNGSLQYQTGIFDYRRDSPVDYAICYARQNAVLILDGVFLLRPELAGCWDFTIFLDVDFEVAVERASQRDQKPFGSVEEAREIYWQRYVPGQRIYLETHRPREHADMVVDNNDPANPRVLIER